jgi:hypothetical protein
MPAIVFASAGHGVDIDLSDEFASRGYIAGTENRVN